ncbi:TRAP transporter small permease [Granulosicoccus sp. 3-233]|uniref:TRAP transporter small permease n=1 Tax=Granulosicoccus sp. 3-233 TaxID=3417969 RepID=UPI003D328CC3
MGMALVGGLLLIGITALTCISIIGRALLPLDLGIGPIQGIYDITEMGMAAAVFAFLPWCQLQRKHATVDLFAPLYPAIMNRSINLLVDVAMCVVASVGAWRMYLGMLDKMRYNETTLILQAPVWIGYLAGVLGLGAFALVAAFCVLRSVRDLRRKQSAGGLA